MWIRALDKTVNFLIQLSIVLILIFGGMSGIGIELVKELNLETTIFPIISILFNMLLIKLIIYTIRKCDVKFDRYELLIIFIVIGSVFVISLLSVLTRKHAYYWDEVESYIHFFWIEDWFKSGTLSGLKILFETIRQDFKGTLAAVFMAVPFAFTNKTQDTWCLSIFFNIIPALAFTYAASLKNIMKKFNSENRRIFFTLNFVIIFFMPLLYTFIQGYTEVFSVIFALIICNLTMNTLKEEAAYKEWIVIGIVTIIMTMIRDFYIIWGIAFYWCYFVANILRLAASKKYGELKKWIIHMAGIGTVFCTAAIIIFWPFINAMQNDSVERDNSFWRVGGYLFEIKNQIGFLGNWTTLLILIGMIGGLAYKKSRNITIFIIGHGVSTLLLFHVFVTLVGAEHSTVLLPFYMMSAALGIYIILKICTKKWQQLFIYNFIILFSTCNILFSFSGGHYFTSIFTKLSLKFSNDQTEQIQMVSDWITDNCSDNETAYFIPHGFPYNPDKFRYINMPDRRMVSIMPYGSAVYGYHEFPSALFNAKYVLTSDPFCEYSVAEKYNTAFLYYCENSSKFDLVKHFDMGDGYRIDVYERKEAADIEEINYYRNQFNEESEKYPSLYKDVFDNYINKNLLNLQADKSH